MNLAPFRIKKFELDDARLRVRLRPVLDPSERESVEVPREEASAQRDIPGYLVTSTAPYNTDVIDQGRWSAENSIEQAQEGIDAIAKDLYRIQKDPAIAQSPELVIAVHGYNTAETNIRAWYSDIYRHIAQDDRQVRHRQNLVFVGYRWSSERISPSFPYFWQNYRALPDVPRALLTLGIGLLLLYMGGLFWEMIRALNLLPLPAISTRSLDAFWNGLGAFGPWIRVGLVLSLNLAIGSTFMVTIAMATLLLLRVSVYFRDVYRAINFAVPDLTELIRQIDQALIDLEVSELNQTYAVPMDAIRMAKWHKSRPHKRVRLSFLGHSMGGLVITNVVRVLSDVFDSGSISHNPTPEIGNTLSLGRLILASPDIPVLSIVSSRANGLASSLRRFEEAYLFSNEGDLALRLASTTANYISFPSSHHHHGHRLGSIALTNQSHQKGIFNLASLREHYGLERPLGEAIQIDPCDILNSLFITHSSGEDEGYRCLGELFEQEHSASSSATLADLFTFFDCTDYRDYQLTLSPNGKRIRSEAKTGLLTRAKGKPHLTLKDYVELLWDMLRGRRDVHGGYFRGEYSRELIYRIAFLGFNGYLTALTAEMEADANSSEGHPPEVALEAFDQRCIEMGIQIYLSPLRYRVDVQGGDLYGARQEMLETVKAKVAESHRSPSKRRSMPLAS